MKKYWISAAVVLWLSLLLTACGAGGDFSSVPQASAPSVSGYAETAPERENPEPENHEPEGLKPEDHELEGPNPDDHQSESQKSEDPKPENPAAKEPPAPPVKEPETVEKADEPVDAQSGDIAEQAQASEEISQEEQPIMKMNVQIGTYTFTATLEDNAAVQELVEMMEAEPVTIHMSDYSGFEKVGPLGRSLTTSNSQTTTTAGDIVLYNGNNIVIFYGSNSWSYTRIGKIDDLTDWAAALGSGDITAIFTV